MVRNLPSGLVETEKAEAAGQVAKAAATVEARPVSGGRLWVLTLGRR